MTTNDLSKDANKLAELANDNLELLNGMCQDKIETQDYYLGVLRKQAILHLDLSAILENRDRQYISTPFIILRSLIDDFLHLLYLESKIDKEIEIIKINAASYKHVFKSLNNLEVSNFKYFDSKYPHYFSNEQLKEFMNQFLSKEENKKYFKNIDTFKFKSFMNFSEMIKCISYSRNVNIFRDRAFYLWKEFSSFVHYSNYTFEYELNNSEVSLQMIDESFQYCYNSIYLSFKYFEREFEMTFKDNVVLRKNME